MDSQNKDSKVSIVYNKKMYKDDISNLWKDQVESGKFEGLVVHSDDGTIYKVKPSINVDAVVIFVTRSKKNKEIMGALGLALYEDGKFFYIGNVGTGFTRDERMEWIDWANRNKKKQVKDNIFVNPIRIVEVNAKDINSGTNIVYDKEFNERWDFNIGSLREPKFIRIREDKKVNSQDIGLRQLPKKHIKSIEIKVKSENSNLSWYRESVKLINLGIDIPQSVDPKDLERIYNIVYMDPTIKNINVNSIEEFINNFKFSYKGKDAINIKNIKQLDGKFLGLINKYYDEFMKIGKENVRHALSLVKEHEIHRLINPNITIEDIKAILGTKEEKAKYNEKKYELVDQKEFDGFNYQLFKALSPAGIKELANKGFNTWCVNSMEYAEQYFNSSVDKGFWYIFKEGKPLFAIGGSDGISSTSNISLSKRTTEIYKNDYRALRFWNSIYGYPLKNQKILLDQDFIGKVAEIKDIIKSEEEMPDKYWDFFFMYSDYFKDIDINQLVKTVLNGNFYTVTGDGDTIYKSDLLVYISNFIIRDTYENSKIDKDLLVKVKRELKEDPDSSIDYMISNGKTFNEKYSEYKESILSNIKKAIEDYKKNQIQIPTYWLESFIKLSNNITQEDIEMLNSLPGEYKMIIYDELKQIGIDVKFADGEIDEYLKKVTNPHLLLDLMRKFKDKINPMLHIRTVMHDYFYDKDINSIKSIAKEFNISDENLSKIINSITDDHELRSGNYIDIVENLNGDIQKMAEKTAMNEVILKNISEFSKIVEKYKLDPFKIVIDAFNTMRKYKNFSHAAEMIYLFKSLLERNNYDYKRALELLLKESIENSLFYQAELIAEIAKINFYKYAMDIFKFYVEENFFLDAKKIYNKYKLDEKYAKSVVYNKIRKEMMSTNFSIDRIKYIASTLNSSEIMNELGEEIYNKLMEYNRIKEAKQFANYVGLVSNNLIEKLLESGDMATIESAAYTAEVPNELIKKYSDIIIDESMKEHRWDIISRLLFSGRLDISNRIEKIYEASSKGHFMLPKFYLKIIEDYYASKEVR